MMKIIVAILLLCTCFSTIHGGPQCTDVNCTCLERELEISLKDDAPPKANFWKASSSGNYHSNAHNISRALFPRQKASAKFIWVKVMFYNTSSKSTRDKEHYIWTSSFIYAVLPRDMLAVVSLGTLYHERHVLELSVPDFCKDLPSELHQEYMEYALSSLQDFTIIPKSSDPRLNTAECVVRIDSANAVSGSGNQLSYVRDIRYVIYVLQIFFSVIGGYIFGSYLKRIYRKLENKEKKEKKENKKRDEKGKKTQIEENEENEESGKLIQKGENKDDRNCDLSHRLRALKTTTALIVFLEIIAQCAVFGIGMTLPRTSFVIVVVVTSFLTFFIPIVLFVWIWCRCRKEMINFAFHLLCYAICYHFSWVVLGAFAEPSLAFLVLLTICSFFLLVYILAYYFSKRSRTDLHGFALFVCFVVVLMFLSFVAFTLISVKFFLTNQFVSSLIQTILTAILFATLSILSYLKPALPIGKDCTSGKNHKPDVPCTASIEMT